MVDDSSAVSFPPSKTALTPLLRLELLLTHGLLPICLFYPKRSDECRERVGRVFYGYLAARFRESDRPENEPNGLLRVRRFETLRV